MIRIPIYADNGIINTTGLDSELYSVPNEEKKIVVFMNRGDLKGGTMGTYVREFQKQYDNVSIEICYFSDYDNEVTSLIKDGNYADIVMVPNNGEITDYSSYFLPLGKTEEMRERYYFADSIVEGGNTYALPIMINTNGVLYNKRVFAEARIQELPRTEEEFLEALRLIKENTDAIPCYLNYDEDWALGQWEYYAYVTMTGDPNYKRNEITKLRNPFSPGAPYYTLYRFMYDIADQGYMEEIGEISWQISKEWMNQGKIGCMVLGSWAVTQIQNAGENSKDIGYMAYPHSVDGKQYMSITSDYAVAIRKNTKYLEEAKAFLEYLLGSSGFAVDLGNLSSDKTVPLPDTMYDMQSVSYLFDTPLSEVSGYQYSCLTKNLNLNDGKEIRRIIDAAIGKSHESFDGIMSEWNMRWESGRDHSAPDSDGQNVSEQYQVEQLYEVKFTEEELECFEETQSLKAVFLKDSAPWQHYDEETEQCDGVGAYICEKLQDKMDIKIEYVFVDNINEAITMLNDGKADIFPCYIGFDVQNTDASIGGSKSYLSAAYVMVQNANVDEAAASAGVLANHSFDPDKIGEELVEYESIEEGLDAVERGEIACLYADYNSVSCQMNIKKYEKISVLPIAAAEGTVSVAFAPDLSVRLKSGINKVLYSISDDEMQALLIRAVMNHTGIQKITIAEFLQQYMVGCLVVIIVVIMCILTIILRNQRIQKKLNRKISISNERYRLITELSEELVFDYDVKRDTILLTDYFAKLYRCPAEVNLKEEATLTPAIKLLGDILKTLSYENVKYDFKFLTPKGNMEWFRILAS